MSKMKKAYQESEMKTIPWHQIYVDPVRNARAKADKSKLEDLAKSLHGGQLQPVVVTNGGSGDQPYSLVAGYRRHAAFELNGWQKKDILVVIRQYEPDDHISPIIDNLVENIQREELSSVDLAQRVFQLHEGTYPVPEGIEPVKLDKETIADRLSISKEQVTKFLRVVNNVEPRLLEQAKAANIPERVLLNMAAVKADDGVEEVDVNRFEKQKEMVVSYKAHQAELKQQGRQRAERSDKGKGKKRGTEGEVGPKPALAETKKIGYVVNRSDAFIRPVSDYVAAISNKLSTRIEKKDEREQLQGSLDTLRFLSGEIKKFPNLVKEDFAFLDEVEEEESEPNK